MPTRPSEQTLMDQAFKDFQSLNVFDTEYEKNCDDLCQKSKYHQRAYDSMNGSIAELSTKLEQLPFP